MSKRIAMGVEYDGSRFLGWQTQAQKPTVQETLEAAISAVADVTIQVRGSGRTDTGVHARGQVVHFDSEVERSKRAWLLGVNSHLPDDVVITWVHEVDGSFDARFSATSRRYIYRITNRWMRPAIGRHDHAWVRPPLNAAHMHQAAQALVGEHDFTSFRSVHCQARHAVRTLHRLEVLRSKDHVTVEVVGNAFLHHMVRNVVGTLLEVGQGKRPVEWVATVLAARDRTEAGATAPAAGLCLEQVAYPASFGLPVEPAMPGAVQ